MFVFEWKLHWNGSYSKRVFFAFYSPNIYIDNGNAHTIVIGFASLNPCVCYSSHCVAVVASSFHVVQAINLRKRVQRQRNEQPRARKKWLESMLSVQRSRVRAAYCIRYFSYEAAYLAHAHGCVRVSEYECVRFARNAKK